MAIQYQPLSVLYTVTVYQDRADYEVRNGFQPPPFDPSKPIRMWADEAQGRQSELRWYTPVDPKTGAYTKCSLWLEEAARPNLPGAYHYPKFEPAPSPAIMVDPQGKEFPIHPRLLIEKYEAEKLAAELGGTAVPMPESGMERWNGETRRQWGIVINGETHSAAALRNSKYALGIGAPGRWDMKGSSPVWVHTLYVDPPADHPVLPVPCRPLREGERLVKRTPFGSYEVATGNEDAPATAASIEQVYALLKQVARVLGVPPEV